LENMDSINYEKMPLEIQIFWEVKHTPPVPYNIYFNKLKDHEK
jgi:hypothetical protein